MALEIEWHNKDPFFDRDLENFKRLHAGGGISIGIIVTRGMSLQRNMVDLVKRFAEEKSLRSSDDLAALGLNPTPRQKTNVTRRMKPGIGFPQAWAEAFVADKFGQATTQPGNDPIA